jgi:hypothetical protein
MSVIARGSVVVAFVVLGVGPTLLSTIAARAQTDASEAKQILVGQFNGYTESCKLQLSPQLSPEECRKTFNDLMEKAKALHLSIKDLQDSGANARAWIDRIGP